MDAYLALIDQTIWMASRPGMNKLYVFCIASIPYLNQLYWWQQALTEQTVLVANWSDFMDFP